MEPFLLILTCISFGLWAAYTWSIRGIQYHTPNTDNELLMYAAAQSHKWQWPSDVHKYSRGKTFMRDVTVFLLAIFQKIFRDKKTDYTYAAMTGFAISFSTILMYLILRHYFGSQAAFFASALYIISFWPWQVSLYGGHANVANMFFLLGVYTLQQPADGTMSIAAAFSVAGIFLCSSLFSSPSSNKFLPLFWITASYTQYELLTQSGAVGNFYSLTTSHQLNVFSILTLLLLVFGYVVTRLSLPAVVGMAYKKTGPAFLNKIIVGQNQFSFEHYTAVARRKLKKIFRISLLVTLFFILALYFVGARNAVYILAGWFFSTLALTLPNIRKSVKDYFVYMYLPQRKTHFSVWVDYYAKRGVTIASNYRGEGWKWVPKFLSLFIPFHLVFFFASWIFLLAQAFIHHRPGDILTVCAVALASASTILWTELTHAPQQARIYSPGVLTMMLFIAYTINQIGLSTYEYSLVVTLLLVPTAIWNLHVFTTDIYPSRMAVRNLLAAIHRFKIKDIYTYSTDYNVSFLTAIPGLSKPEYMPPDTTPPPVHIHYIDSLAQVPADSWIVIPSTNPTGISAGLDATKGEFDQDPQLNQLLANRSLDAIAAIKFKTYGSSIYWIQESDVGTWQYLTRHEVDPDRMYRGFGWLINSDKLGRVH